MLTIKEVSVRPLIPKPPPLPTLIKEIAKKHNNRRGLFQCNGCKNKFEAYLSDVKPHKTKSCGCHRSKMSRAQSYKHGHRGAQSTTSITYITWQDMIRRCMDKDNSSYEDYGGRGIKVCKRWLKFENFYEDMGIKPKGLSIERTDNNKGYCKLNCKWATVKQQSQNKRTTVVVMYNYKRIPLYEVYKISGSIVPYKRVIDRIYNGWTTLDALLTPVRKKRMLC